MANVNSDWREKAKIDSTLHRSVNGYTPKVDKTLSDVE